MLLLTIFLVVVLTIITILCGILLYLSAKDQQVQHGFVGKIVVNCRDFKTFKFVDFGHALRWYNYQTKSQQVEGGPEIIIQLYEDGVLIKEKKL